MLDETATAVIYSLYRFANKEDLSGLIMKTKMGCEKSILVNVKYKKRKVISTSMLREFMVDGNEIKMVNTFFLLSLEYKNR